MEGHDKTQPEDIAKEQVVVTIEDPVIAKRVPIDISVILHFLFPYLTAVELEVVARTSKKWYEIVSNSAFWISDPKWFNYHYHAPRNCWLVRRQLRDLYVNAAIKTTQDFSRTLSNLLLTSQRDAPRHTVEEFRKFLSSSLERPKKQDMIPAPKKSGSGALLGAGPLVSSPVSYQRGLRSPQSPSSAKDSPWAYSGFHLDAVKLLDGVVLTDIRTNVTNRRDPSLKSYSHQLITFPACSTGIIRERNYCFVDKVLSFSSQGSRREGGAAHNLIGQPQSYPFYGPPSVGGTWSAKRSHGEKEEFKPFVVIHIAEKLFIEKIWIFQTYIPTALVRVRCMNEETLKFEDVDFVPQYIRRDKSSVCRARIDTYGVNTASKRRFLTDMIELHFSSDVQTFCIDAIKFFGPDHLEDEDSEESHAIPQSFFMKDDGTKRESTDSLVSDMKRRLTGEKVALRSLEWQQNLDVISHNQKYVKHFPYDNVNFAPFDFARTQIGDLFVFTMLVEDGREVVVLLLEDGFGHRDVIFECPFIMDHVLMVKLLYCEQSLMIVCKNVDNDKNAPGKDIFEICVWDLESKMVVEMFHIPEDEGTEISNIQCSADVFIYSVVDRISVFAKSHTNEGGTPARRTWGFLVSYTVDCIVCSLALNDEVVNVCSVIIAGCMDGKIRLWNICDVEREACCGVIDVGCNGEKVGPICCVQIIAAGALIACSIGQKIHIFDILTHARVRIIDLARVSLTGEILEASPTPGSVMAPSFSTVFFSSKFFMLFVRGSDKFSVGEFCAPEHLQCFDKYHLANSGRSGVSGKENQTKKCVIL